MHTLACDWMLRVPFIGMRGSGNYGVFILCLCKHHLNRRKLGSYIPTAAFLVARVLGEASFPPILVLLSDGAHTARLCGLHLFGGLISVLDESQQAPWDCR